MFTGYVKKTMQETRKHYFIKEKKYKDLICFMDYGGIFDEFHQNPPEFEPESPLCLESMIDDLVLFHSIQNLTMQQKNVMYKFYMLEKTEVEISRELKISRQAVNKIRKKALFNIKKYYGSGK